MDEKNEKLENEEVAENLSADNTSLENEVDLASEDIKAEADGDINENAPANENNSETLSEKSEEASASTEEKSSVARGEYRYTPPYATYGANVTRTEAKFTPPITSQSEPSPEENKKQAKKKPVGRMFSGGAVALLIIACMVISLGSGFLGAYIVTGGRADSGDVSFNTNDELVIYQAATVVDENGDELKGELTVSQVKELVADSVVEITTEFQTSYGPYQYVSEGAGSGVIISSDGYVITNNHVITGDSSSVADTIIVRLTNGEEYDATVIGTDSESDIALLKIEETDLKAAIIGDSDKIVVGQNIVAVGNPLGELGGTVTSGIVSATGRTIDVDGTEMTLLQIDAAVNPGNSGGGLFNRSGELVGIVNAKSTGTGVEGLGFAIPSNDAVKVVEQLKTNGYVTGRTFIGVTFYDVQDSFTAYQYFGTQTIGIYVYSTEEGYNDGALKSGDRVVAVNGEEIIEVDDIKAMVKACEVGDMLEFTVYRRGKLTTVMVECFEYIPESAVDFGN